MSPVAANLVARPEISIDKGYGGSVLFIIIIGLVIAVTLIAIFIARGHESSSPLKTVESFKVGLEKISPEDERASSSHPQEEAGPDLFRPEKDHESKQRAEGA